MIGMLIIGYCFGIRSERRLCEEAHLNLAYRWFCRLGLEDPVPDHSTFSKNRHGRFRDSDLFRHVFENVLKRCMQEGLVGGEGFAVDASTIKADAKRARAVPGTDIADCKWDSTHASRAVREYLHRKKVEMLFAHLKRILKLDRLRLRGYSGAHDEFLLAATAQNLRKMAHQMLP